MTDFIQLLLSGTATGAIYALAALGFTLLWQASGTINFASTSASPGWSVCTEVNGLGVEGSTGKRKRFTTSPFCEIEPVRTSGTPDGASVGIVKR